MPEANANNHAKRTFILTTEEWLDLKTTDENVIFGTPDNPLVRPMTKNLIEAPEKCFKTTFTLRLMMGLSCGNTVYPELPVARNGKVLYLHGELSNAEIQERTRAAVDGLNGPFEFRQGKALDAHLVKDPGQRVLEAIVKEYMPDHLVLDPFQSFIPGCDENLFKDMSAAEKFCDRLIADCGLTLWIPIHLGKNPTKGARGHSSIAGWRDTKISLSKGYQTDGVTVRVEPRWAKSPPAFHLKFTNGTLKIGAKTQVKFTGQTAELHAFVESRGGKALKEEVVEHLGKGRDAARKAIGRAEAAGAVHCEGDYVLIPLTPDVAPGTKPS
jgi:hypothetical protein